MVRAREWCGQVGSGRCGVRRGCGGRVGGWARWRAWDGKRPRNKQRVYPVTSAEAVAGFFSRDSRLL